MIAYAASAMLALALGSLLCAALLGAGRAAERLADFHRAGRARLARYNERHP